MITKITVKQARKLIGHQPILAAVEWKKRVISYMRIVPSTGKILSFQSDDNKKYTGKIAICDTITEARYFAYESREGGFQNKGDKCEEEI